jgi:hypothetical protein
MRKLFVWVVALALAGCSADEGGECSTGQVKCGEQCVATDSDPQHCGECGNKCAQDQFCHLGVCAQRCDHECRTQGELRCADAPENGVVSCGNHDTDVCLEWGGLQSCGAGETCSGAVCSGTCENECETDGQTECDDGQDGFKTCGDYDDDACLEWSAVSECGSDEICQDGACQAGCIEPDEDCKEWDDCCDYPDQGYHCCPVFHFCVKDFW